MYACDGDKQTSAECGMMNAEFAIRPGAAELALAAVGLSAPTRLVRGRCASRLARCQDAYSAFIIPHSSFRIHHSAFNSVTALDYVVGQLLQQGSVAIQLRQCIDGLVVQSVQLLPRAVEAQ